MWHFGWLWVILGKLSNSVITYYYTPLKQKLEERESSHFSQKSEHQMHNNHLTFLILWSGIQKGAKIKTLLLKEIQFHPKDILERFKNDWKRFKCDPNRFKRNSFCSYMRRCLKRLKHHDQIYFKNSLQIYFFF